MLAINKVVLEDGFMADSKLIKILLIIIAFSLPSQVMAQSREISGGFGLKLGHSVVLSDYKESLDFLGYTVMTAGHPDKRQFFLDRNKIFDYVGVSIMPISGRVARIKARSFVFEDVSFCSPYFYQVNASLTQKYGSFDATLADNLRFLNTQYESLFRRHLGDYLVHVWFGSYLGYPTALALSCEEALPVGPRMELGLPPRSTVLSLEYFSPTLLSFFVDEVGKWNLDAGIKADDF